MKAGAAGFFQKYYNAGDEVRSGFVLAKIIDPYDGRVLDEIVSPCNGVVFYVLNKPLALRNAPLFRIKAY